jgi:curved DNA-binding protein CbpA
VPTHYEVLGVEASTSPEDLRRAYVRRARALHPDRHVGADPDRTAVAARAMQEVNEAWRVLRDPAARAAYDARLRRPERPPAPVRAPSAGPPVQTVPDEPVVRVVRGLPWVAAALVLAAIFIFTAFAAGSADDGGRSPSSWVGQCVTGSAGSQIREVGCDTEGASRVDLVVVRASQCGAGSSATPVDDAWLCLRPVDD